MQQDLCGCLCKPNKVLRMYYHLLVILTKTSISLMALRRLRRICNTDEKFDIRSSEYQNHLIARDYKPTLVKRQFHAIKNNRHEARQVKPKVIKSNFNSIVVYNPVMKNLEKILNDDLHILYGDPDMKKMFPEGTIRVTYRRGKCLKELVSPSLYPLSQSLHLELVSVNVDENRCDICKNYMVFKNEFSCTANGKTCKLRSDLFCKSDNVIYLIGCKTCKQQYVGSAYESNFNRRFTVHKMDINTDKVRCGVAKHFLNNCTGINKLKNVEVQFIEEVKEGNYDLEGKPW